MDYRINKINSRRRLIVVTNGDFHHMLYISLFIYSILKNFPDLITDWRFTILCPKSINLKDTILNKLSQFYEVKNFDFIPSADTYYTKFLLKLFVNSSKNWCDGILCLDADHIVRRPFQLPILDQQVIYVSSELKPINILAKSTHNFPDEILSSTFHFNNSLIYARPSTLKKALSQWNELYNQYQNKIPDRYREEIAFYMSSIRSGIRLVPVSLEDQSSWFSNVENCGLFHYGGENANSTVLRKAIISAFSSPNQSEGEFRNDDPFIQEIMEFMKTFKREVINPKKVSIP